MRPLTPVLFLTILCACRTSSAPEDVSNCRLGPISVPMGVPTSCAPIAPKCPQARPAAARTLVSVFVCIFPTASAPCPVHASVCPLLDSNGVALHFAASESDSVCQSTVDIRLQPFADGSVGISWTAQERSSISGICELIGSESAGSGAVSRPCCSTTLDIPLPNERKTFRLTVQTDWQF
jgi:hypothetical protein